uniref:Nucleoporin Nup50 n=1 Tax=Tetrahymena thermophila TaxID=5911 RepID=D3KYT9_TETTH|nr:nucleoporin Nup50 [Tetrahymena thermophila]
MSKRRAPYELDQNNLSDDEHAAPDLGRISTPEEIAQRRILKIKGPKSEESTTPAKLVLLEKLEDAQPAANNNGNHANEAKEGTNGDKIEEKKIEFSTSSSLFAKTDATNGNNKHTENKEESKPEQSEKETEKVSEPAKEKTTNDTSLFGSIKPSSATSGLFGNTSTTGGLFGKSTGTGTLFGNSNSLFTPSSGTGLFSNANKVEGGQTIQNIFNTDKPTGSLFGSLPTSNATSLFGNAKPAESSSLFGDLKNNTTGGLFSNIKSKGSDDEGDEGEGEDDDELEHSPEIDPSQIQMKYQYDNPYEKVIDKSVLKVRRGDGDILEKGYISFEKFKADDKTPNILVYRDQIKKVIFTIVVTKKINKAEKIQNSTKNLKFIFYKKQDEKFVPDIIKVQFHDEKDGEEFYNKFQEYTQN